MKNKKITVDQINNLSYTDFVGLINQWNVLPGGYNTLSKWIMYANIDNHSKILEVACTTGFSSREIALQTNCEGIGFDISEASVKTAQYNKDKYAPNININYQTEDGYKFQTNTKFTHVIFGAALRFFPDPQQMLKLSLSFLEDEGFILASEFYAVEKIPDELIKRAQDIFNITPTEINYKEVMKIYEGLDVIYEDRNIIFQETEEELNHYCQSTINRACKMLKITDNDVIDVMYQRLYKIKEMSNLLRPYQNYNVLVLRYRSKIYPNRYFELF